MLRLLLALLTLLVGAPALAQPLAAGRNHIAAELVAETATPAAGQTVTLAFSFTPERGWHGYWFNPGDAGVPATLAWQLPAGVEAGPLRYPVPKPLSVSGIMNYVFEGPYALLTTLRVPQGLAPGTRLPVRVRIDYLACTDEICVPERADLALDLTVGAGATTPELRTRFDAWRAALPRPLGTEGTYELNGSRLRIAVPLPASVGLDQPYLFPATLEAVDHSAPQSISRNGDAVIIEASAKPGATLNGFEGLLRIGEGRGLSFNAGPGPVPAAGDPIAQEAAPAEGVGLLAALLGAILGGLILNVMPCVFPILSLKALSLARAGETPQGARREALAYSAGVILTCLALGGLLLALRAGGATIGWAFQLQEPRFVLFLLLLVTAIALNLTGLFRLPALSIEQNGGATTSAFGTGALAAFIATPCTGPFMAAALGATLALPALGALAVFGGLGLGLALPFLLLGFVPGLRGWLPRPGPWMVTMQRILSIPMFLTALGLAWVLGRQTGVDGMTLGIAAAIALGLSLWWLGVRAGTWQRWLAIGAAFIAIVTPMLLLRPAPPAAAASAGNLGAERFSEARLAQLRGEGRPVFLYFTADWCITCKVNEGGALASGEVADSFRTRGISVLEGDWTLGDAAIGRFLERHGRSGVPLYLYYPPRGEARVLPQVLTTSILTALPT